MSFGNFLLGVAEGLDRGIEAGEYIKGAQDRKKVRDAGKKYNSDQKMIGQMASTGLDRATNPGAAPMAPKPAIAPAPMDPSKIAAPTTMAQHMPEGGQMPMRPPRAYAPPQQSPSEPAQTMGAQAPTFNVQFPGAVAGAYGVTGQPNPYFDGQQYPQPY